MVLEINGTVIDNGYPGPIVNGIQTETVIANGVTVFETHPTYTVNEGSYIQGSATYYGFLTDPVVGSLSGISTIKDVEILSIRFYNSGTGITSFQVVLEGNTTASPPFQSVQPEGGPVYNRVSAGSYTGPGGSFPTGYTTYTWSSSIFWNGTGSSTCQFFT